MRGAIEVLPAIEARQLCGFTQGAGRRSILGPMTMKIGSTTTTVYGRLKLTSATLTSPGATFDTITETSRDMHICFSMWAVQYISWSIRIFLPQTLTGLA